MDDDQALSPQSQSAEYIDIKSLMPANPIYAKPAKEQPKPVLRIEIVKNDAMNKNPLRPVFKKQSDSQRDEEDDGEINTEEEEQDVFEVHYQTSKCVYKRFANQEKNGYGRVRYYASLFVDKKLFKQNKETLGSMAQLRRDVLGEVQPQQNQAEKSKTEVTFNSQFESGNLFSVYKKNPTQYDLVLQNDINTRGNTQWFYFTVANLPQNVQITFNIVNLQKSDSLFNYGLQPIVLSETKLNKIGQSWTRQGRCISYFRNSIRRERSKRFYYTLTFKLTSRIANDVLHIAHCFPYTVSQLKEYITNIIKNAPKKGTIVSRSSIGKSVANNPIELLTITDTQEKKPDNRKIIIIMARQHPGESQGSYVCEGAINFILSKKGDWLRKNYIFKIIPMVNPDGVIFGNYRSNLMGLDLNRKWDVSDKDGCFPEVKCIKQFILELNKDKKVKTIIDLHGHSKKLNSFFYGNPCPQHPELVRGFPFVCSKLNSQITFQDCTFTIEQEKRKAARVYLSLKHNLTNVYTFESSFYGYTKDGKKFHFGTEQFRGLGATLMQSLHLFLQYDSLVEEKAFDKLSGLTFYKYLCELRDNPNLIQLGDRKQSGSESNPEQFEVKNPGEHKKDPKVVDQQGYDNSDDGNKRQLNGIPLMSSNPSRKGKRQIKQMIRNTRQLKVMEISRVNSVLPDKYSCQLALQPSSSIPCISDQADKRRSTLRSSMKDLKISVYVQTNPIEPSQWDDMKIIDIDELEYSKYSSNLETSYQDSIRFKDNIQIKYINLTSTRGKKHNNNLLKINSLNCKPLETRNTQMGTTYGTSTCFFKTKSKHTQTFLTSQFFANRFRSITHFPSVDAASERIPIKGQTRHKNLLRTNRISSKRDNQDFLNDMVRKYLLNLKEHTKTNPTRTSHDDKTLLQRSSPLRIEQTNIRPLSIKKKQILTPKKIHCKSRS